MSATSKNAETSRPCLKGLELDVHNCEDACDKKSKHDLCHSARLDESNEAREPQLSLHFCELPIVKSCLVARE